MKCIVALAVGLLLAANTADAQTSRFYVRGDLGLALGTPSVETDTNPGSPIASLGPDTINGTLGTGAMFDMGVGLRAFSFLRFEGSLGFIPSFAFKGSFGSSSGATVAQGTVDALVGLATANIDLTALTGPLPGGLQPFVLGGVGFANVTNSGEDDFFNGTYVNTISGGAQTNLAWTVGAGVGVPIAERLTLDITWRWLDLGERRVGPTLFTPGGSFPLTQDRADLRVDTIMMGLRYQL
jgi:opacity protein-like surface antigen